MKIIDLSRELYHRTPTYPGQPPIIHGIWKTHAEAFVDSGNVHGNGVMYFSMPDHGGTHIDAPRHFGPNATPIDEYPLENCIVPGICLDLRHAAPRAEITPADLEAAAADDQAVAMLHAAIGKLPPLQRTLLTLYHLEDMPIGEISRVTGLADGTIKSHLFRSRKLLRGLLEPSLGVFAA